MLYITGDGKTFTTKEAAIEHADRVARSTGVIIAVEAKRQRQRRSSYGARRAKELAERTGLADRIDGYDRDDLGESPDY